MARRQEQNGPNQQLNVQGDKKDKDPIDEEKETQMILQH